MVSADRSLFAASPRSANRTTSREAHLAARATACRSGRATAARRRTIRPSTRRTSRSARAPTSGSWVISTMVRPAALSSSKTLQHVVGGVAVQVAGRLVGEQQGGLGDQRPGHRDALLLAAGELVGLVLGAVGEADRVQRRQGPRGGARAASTPAYASGSSTLASALVRGIRLNAWKMKPISRLRARASCRSDEPR